MSSPALARDCTGSEFVVEGDFSDSVEFDVGCPDADSVEFDVGCPDVAATWAEQASCFCLCASFTSWLRFCASLRRASLAFRCSAAGSRVASSGRVLSANSLNQGWSSSGGTLMSVLGSMSRSRSTRRSSLRRSRVLAAGDAQGAGACRSSVGVDGAKLFFETFGTAVACCSTALERFCSSRTADCCVCRRSACLRSVA